MIKTGILTFHRAHNYGSVLQAYALAKTLNKFPDCKAQIIDYIPPLQYKLYRIFDSSMTSNGVKKNIHSLMHYKMRKNRYDDFIKFQETLLPLSDNRDITADSYDAIIVGSDQIWNPILSDFNEIFLLKGDYKGKKIAYAPSLGNYGFDDNQFNQMFIGELKNFIGISVREIQARNSIKNLCPDLDVKIMPDPSMLLSVEDYDEICSDRFIKEKYIFFYSINYNEQVVEQAVAIARRLNMPLVIVYTTEDTYKVKYDRLILSNRESPGDFISLIKNAELVLTNSFHGMVFSILYHKRFYTLTYMKDNKVFDNYRVTSLLNKLGLDDLMINPRAVSYDSLMEKNVDWNQVDLLKNDFCREGIEFLRTNLYK
jgi:hypothetical protein